MSKGDRDYELFSALVEQTRADLQKRGALPDNPLPRDWDEPRLSQALNDPKWRGRATESTFQAVLWVLCTYGVARLADDWMLPRLAEFSSEQMRELVAALRRIKASGQWPRVTDELVGKLEALTHE